MLVFPITRNSSYDAYPQLERLLEGDNMVIKENILKIFKDSRLEKDYDWQEYNYSRGKALNIIQKYH
ncbi:hypothetical protein BGV40_16015 [Methanosarcina sp. Ant1]|nr:hypothetical protein BGV40_16015 [Methanosarcina sp. Ant1]